MDVEVHVQRFDRQSWFLHPSVELPLRQYPAKSAHVLLKVSRVGSAKRDLYTYQEFEFSFPCSFASYSYKSTHNLAHWKPRWMRARELRGRWSGLLCDPLHLSTSKPH